MSGSGIIDNTKIRVKNENIHRIYERGGA
jgi:hypothetical protein